MKAYDHKKIEKKWQKKWERSKLYKADDTSKKPTFYGLIEFPFPSGAGMHVGHLRSNTGMDVIARKRRMEGYNVLYPIGWDAFGLPTENYAIKTGLPPKKVTKQNTDNFRKQLKSAGFSFDWSREINTTDPAYYKWTQWIFLQMYKNDLAYKKKMVINWCPKDKIGLANEEVVNGCCERCGTPVEKREKEQWMLAITKYADRLDKDLDLVDYQEKIKIQQRNWIGKSEGAEIDFDLVSSKEKIKIFTTRPDTLFGATYVVLSPEHSLIQSLQNKISNYVEVEKYVSAAKKKDDIERTSDTKEKTGVELKGIKAINPATKEEIPVFVADYVLAHYGTGAVMAVPAHDERDYEFAKKHDLPIKEVIIPRVVDSHDPPMEGKKTVERKSVQVILINPKNQKVLMLRWKKFPWTTFITGGIEEGEEVIDAAFREVHEETGYKNIRYVKTLGGPVESHFFANHKDENRKALFTALVFELENEEQDEMSEEDKSIHDLSWMTWKELEKDSNIKCSEYPIWIDRFFNPPHAFTDEGVLVNSNTYSGMQTAEAKEVITNVFGTKKVSYKLRDWIFSRQRYWGEPIPMIHCASCGWVPVPEKDLPVLLPDVKKYEPTDTGESPLADITKWVNTKCPTCKGPARRETDTMPNWAGSSWYYLRYIDPKNKKAFADPKKINHWNQVDWYNGGMEHTTLHLLYSRFWHKFLFDMKLVPTPEPYKKRTSHGLILASDGSKISKSKGNTIDQDTIIERVGADSLRLYEMFMGPFDQAVSWNDDGVVGPRRFLERVWKLQEKVVKKLPFDADLESSIHKTVKKVSEDIESMQFNTAISALMILLNDMDSRPQLAESYYKHFLGMLAPFAPHIVEELWSNLGHKTSIHSEKWMVANPAKMAQNNVILAIQINGKVRAELQVGADAKEEDIKSKIMEISEIKKWIEGKEIKKIIYVKGRVVNIVAL